MATYDYYREAKSLAEDLKRAGLSDCEAAIVVSMEGGGTGTEIFMIMRARLAYILTTKDVPPKVLERVKALHSKLNDALQS